MGKQNKTKTLKKNEKTDFLAAEEQEKKMDFSKRAKLWVVLKAKKVQRH